MILPIAQLGQPVLRETAQEVPLAELHSPHLQQFIKDMRETLADAGGVGLAAPQVFDRRRIFLAAVLPPLEPEGMPQVEVFINPALTHASAEKAGGWEGCLSFPELLVLVPRHRAARLSYFDANGDACTIDLQG